MPLNLLKFTIVASLHGKPHPHCHSSSSSSSIFLDKCLRRTTTTTIISRQSPGSRTLRPVVMSSRGWRLAPCAPIGPPSAHDRNKFVSGKLGFRGQTMGGDVSGTKYDQWMESDPSPTSTLPSHNHQHRQKPPVIMSQQQKHQQHQSKKLLTLPTILTIGRVVAVPLLVSTFYMNSWWGTTATTSIFILAAITDWLDGYLARRMNLGSAFGAFLDPVADKLMVAATLVLLCTRPPDVAMFGQLPWLLTVPSIAIIGREITMSAVREWAASQGSKLSEAVAVNKLGKWKTATQMISLTILLVTRDSSFTEAGILVASGVALLYISAVLAVWSLVVYMKRIWKVLLM